MTAQARTDANSNETTGRVMWLLRRGQRQAEVRGGGPEGVLLVRLGRRAAVRLARDDVRQEAEEGGAEGDHERLVRPGRRTYN